MLFDLFPHIVKEKKSNKKRGWATGSVVSGTPLAVWLTIANQYKKAIAQEKK